MQSPTEQPREPLQFIEKPLRGDEPARCVDGRKATKSPQGPQMLGGSIQPLITEAIYKYKDFDVEFVTEGLQKLQDLGFTTGVHRGSHRKPEKNKSDCGLSDELIGIIAIAIAKRAQITEKLGAIYDELGLTRSGIEVGYAHLSIYTEKIKVTGEQLVDKAVQSGANDETVEDDHRENVAFFNLKEDTTFDTQEANSQGWQAFNQDAWMAVKQANALGVEKDAATALAGILYIATEIKLVEEKGKPALPVVIHK